MYSISSFASSLKNIGSPFSITFKFDVVLPNSFIVSYSLLASSFIPSWLRILFDVSVIAGFISMATIRRASTRWLITDSSFSVSFCFASVHGAVSSMYLFALEIIPHIDSIAFEKCKSSMLFSYSEILLATISSKSASTSFILPL